MHPHVRNALDAAAVPYTERRHADLAVAIHSPAEFAAALGYSIERITKTLFLRASDQRAFALVTCSVTQKLDMSALAAHFGWRRSQVASREDLLAETGYPPAGVSPLGAGPTPVIMDTSLLSLPTILVGGGEVAIEVELAPADLQRAAQATVLPITIL